jgi:hypothetical protein
MNESASRFLKRLEQMNWFANCGTPIEGPYERVHSHQAARKLYAGRNGMRWENFKLAIVNRQGLLIWDKIEGWLPEVQKEIRATDAAVESFVAENRARIFATIPEDPDLRRMVRLDVAWMTGEVEDNLLPPLNFFTERLLPVYERGHMPCGWSGGKIARDWAGDSLKDLPEGKLVVF